MKLPKRPTISLAIIAKNEEKNLPRLLKSVEGCFDEIVVVDTGSTDKTVQIAKDAGCLVHHFEWVNSFCKARNFAFSKCTQDYICWLDCDDVLSSQKDFIQWRDHAMEFVEVWLNTYNYALDTSGKPIVQFMRERVFRRSINPTWRYDLHEGVLMSPAWSHDFAVTWTVNHLRDQEDMKQDKNRNLTILEAMENKDARMTFYYGKELYEAGKPVESIPVFEKAVLMKDLAPHDKLLSFQYGSYACQYAADQLKDEFKDKKLEYYNKALNFAFDGLKIDANRAELHVAIGDTYLKMGNLVPAIPHYAAAKACIHPKANGNPYSGAIYNFDNCYGELPSLQLAKIYANIGKLEESKKEALECMRLYQNVEAGQVLEEVERIQRLTTIDNNQEETKDIVITCPPQAAYPFDERLYREKGMGGSETALIEMAMHLKKFTNRNVIVYNVRDDDFVSESGVEYRSNRKINDYFSKYKPFVHIAWRHNIELTRAKTYLWCHDLVTATVEGKKNFDKILCLTEFHKNYVMAKQGVPEDKIIVTRNGISPEKFQFAKKPKNPNKLVWMSSPDRGLETAMNVCDEVRKSIPDVELHVYYGLDNLYKYGMGDLAKKLDQMMKDRPYVKYHGFTEQNKMYQEVSDAVVWCHPCNFIETFCITALEMLALGVYPVTRRLGGLANTLGLAEKNGQAVLMDHDAYITQDIINKYAEEIKTVLKNKLWEKVSLNIQDHSWESVAKEWIKGMEL